MEVFFYVWNGTSILDSQISPECDVKLFSLTQAGPVPAHPRLLPLLPGLVWVFFAPSSVALVDAFPF